jgi:CubicO group peptidase (beta-lactamase class C family)
MSTTIRLPLSLLLLTVALSCVAEAPEAGGGPTAGIDSIFTDLDDPTSPGAAVAVVRDGQVIFREGYGSANLEHQIPITPSTVFDIASVSKQFAGFAVSTLVEDGTISLTDDVRRYIPELPEFGHTITLDHLVHHTSGLRDWPGTLAISGWRMDDVISFDQILTMAFNQQDLNFVPGAEYTYSNTGFNLLAEVVARATGTTFREWTHANIFQPLGMTSTHFHDNHLEVVANRAYGYAVGADDEYSAVPNGLTALGSSSLYTSVDDLAKWLSNFDDPRVGGRTVIERMKTRGVLNDGSEIQYAFGVAIGEYRGSTTVSHGGSWASFRTHLVHFPEHRFGVVVLGNHSPFNPSEAAFRIADLFLEDVLGPVEEAEAGLEEAPVVEVPAARLRPYAGTYKLGPAWYVRVSLEEGGLQAQATAEDPAPMTPRSETEFWVEDYGASVVFHRHADGRISHFSYRGIQAPKIEDIAVPSRGQLSAYTGEFVSTELGTSYDIVLDEEGLVAHHRAHGNIRLTPAWRDDFRGSEWFLQSVEFQRDASGDVMGLLVNAGERNRNLRFEKRQ